MSQWTYKQTEPNLWTVGFYTPNGEWETDSDHNTRQKAAQRVAELNGHGGWRDIERISHLEGTTDHLARWAQRNTDALAELAARIKKLEEQVEWQAELIMRVKEGRP